MPWFFFKSGMFDKDQQYAIIWKKVLHTLIIPYLFFSIVSWLIWLPQFLYSQDSLVLLLKITFVRWVTLNIIPGNNPMWFLIALIGCRLLYPCFKKFLRNNYLIALSGFIMAYMYHLIYMDITHRYVMLGFAQSCIGMAYYALGAELCQKQYFKSVFIISFAVYIVAIVLFIPVINLAYAGSFSSELSWACSLPICVAGIITWNNLVRLIPSRFLNVSGLCYVGNNSMTYYSMHWSIIITLVFLYNDFGVRLLGIPVQWVMLLSCAVILPVADVLLRRYLPWAVGAKERVHKGHEVGAAADPLP